MDEIEDKYVDWYFMNYSLMEDLEAKGYKWVYFAREAPELDVAHVLITDEFGPGDLVVTKKLIHIMRAHEMGLAAIGGDTRAAAITARIMSPA